MAEKPILAVDGDDVLWQNAERFVAHSNTNYGTSFLPKDYDDDWATLWGVPEEICWERADAYYDTGAFAELAPVPGAQAALGRLAADFKIVLVTGRRSTIADVTINRAQTDFPDVFSGFHFLELVRGAAPPMPKGLYCARLGARFLVDNARKHAVNAAEHGVQGLYFGNRCRSHRRQVPEGVTRVSDWRRTEAVLHNLHG